MAHCPVHHAFGKAAAQPGPRPRRIHLGRKRSVACRTSRTGNARASCRKHLESAVRRRALHPLRLAARAVSTRQTRSASRLGFDARCGPTSRPPRGVPGPVVESRISARSTCAPGVPALAHPAGEDRSHSQARRTEFVEPRYDHPEFQRAFAELNDLLAARFDGDPLIEWVDLMQYGFWGEGHTSTLPESVRRFLLGGAHVRGHDLQAAADLEEDAARRQHAA